MGGAYDKAAGSAGLSIGSACENALKEGVRALRPKVGVVSCRRRGDVISLDTV